MERLGIVPEDAEYMTLQGKFDSNARSDGPSVEGAEGVTTSGKRIGDTEPTYSKGEAPDIHRTERSARANASGRVHVSFPWGMVSQINQRGEVHHIRYTGRSMHRD